MPPMRASAASMRASAALPSSSRSRCSSITSGLALATNCGLASFCAIFSSSPRERCPPRARAARAPCRDRPRRQDRAARSRRPPPPAARPCAPATVAGLDARQPRQAQDLRAVALDPRAAIGARLGDIGGKLGRRRHVHLGARGADRRDERRPPIPSPPSPRRRRAPRRERGHARGDQHAAPRARRDGATAPR